MFYKRQKLKKMQWHHYAPPHNGCYYLIVSTIQAFSIFIFYDFFWFLVILKMPTSCIQLVCLPALAELPVQVTSSDVISAYPHSTLQRWGHRLCFTSRRVERKCLDGLSQLVWFHRAKAVWTRTRTWKSFFFCTVLSPLLLWASQMLANFICLPLVPLCWVFPFPQAS